MKIIEARNVHEALIKGIYELQRFGIPRDSRNGPVLVMPTPVTTVYEQPIERVVFWPQRDANPFFHLYEALWMLCGRNDVAPLSRYARNILNYADDGIIHGAYGHRWRKAFGIDQLKVIINRLRSDKDDRRCVLQMWNTESDLDMKFRDLPCNVIATFQRNVEGNLDLTVFCRSNDIIWGAYGANAVHFSFLLEYMANSIGCGVGRYYQVSVNWHAYKDILAKMTSLGEEMHQGIYSVPTPITNPYGSKVYPTPMPGLAGFETSEDWQEEMDDLIYKLVHVADNGFPEEEQDLPIDVLWYHVCYYVLRAHHIFKRLGSDPKRIDIAIQSMEPVIDFRFDWVQAAVEWFERRGNRK